MENGRYYDRDSEGFMDDSGSVADYIALIAACCLLGVVYVVWFIVDSVWRVVTGAVRAIEYAVRWVGSVVRFGLFDRID